MWSWNPGNAKKTWRRDPDSPVRWSGPFDPSVGEFWSLAFPLLVGPDGGCCCHSGGISGPDGHFFHADPVLGRWESLSPGVGGRNSGANGGTSGRRPGGGTNGSATSGSYAPCAGRLFLWTPPAGASLPEASGG